MLGGKNEKVIEKKLFFLPLYAVSCVNSMFVCNMNRNKNLSHLRPRVA